MDPLSLFLQTLLSGPQVKPVPMPTPIAQEQIVALGEPGGGFGGGAQPPRISAATRGTPYGQLGCMQRAQNALYSSGATSVSSSENTVVGNYSGTSALAWCRGDQVILIGAGPQADAAVQALKSGF